jgi:sialate O-acetylesterase
MPYSLSKPIHLFLSALLFVFSFLFLGLTGLPAAVTMPSIFGDHMVLQQGVKLPVWGWAAAGENVIVQLGKVAASTVTAEDGSWKVNLPPVSATIARSPQTLTVTGSNTLTFQDVLVGDVWIASGQSNMEFGIGNDTRGAAAIASANEPQIRLFLVPDKIALEPQKDLRPGGAWKVCSPETLKGNGQYGWIGFSAAGYYFAREIHQKTGQPVGMIGAYLGGSAAQVWTSLSGLKKAPDLAHFVQEREAVRANYAQAQADLPKKMDAYLAAMEDWKSAAAKAAAAGQPEPPKPPGPASPEGGAGCPGNLFNAMIAPLVPYAIKGVIWYQGEGNTNNAKEYATLFPLLISDWRTHWQQGDFPFIFVQLANFTSPQKSPSEEGWATLREAQLQTLSLPNTGMAVAIDIGNPADIHPRDKFDVGHRLALVARHLAYGEALVDSGPIYKSMTIEGHHIRLLFNHVGAGLTMGVPPWMPDGSTPPVPKELAGFAIAGSDQKWVWGKAVIEGGSVVVSSDQLSSPVAVRYDWANCPAGNLYNKDGLPASPFRTDKW